MKINMGDLDCFAGLGLHSLGKFGDLGSILLISCCVDGASIEGEGEEISILGVRREIPATNVPANLSFGEPAAGQIRRELSTG
jgi:hypothetical protein